MNLATVVRLTAYANKAERYNPFHKSKPNPLELCPFLEAKPWMLRSRRTFKLIIHNKSEGLAHLCIGYLKPPVRERLSYSPQLLQGCPLEALDLFCYMPPAFNTYRLAVTGCRINDSNGISILLDNQLKLDMSCGKCSLRIGVRSCPYPLKPP